MMVINAWSRHFVELFSRLVCQLTISFHTFCEGSGDVVGVLTLLVGGVAQAFHDDRVVELRVQLGVEEVERKGQGGTGRSRKGEASQRECAMDDMEMVMKRLRSWANEVWDDITRCGRVRAMCELSALCAPRKRLCERRHWCTCVLCELHFDVRVHVIPLVVCDDAVIDLTLVLIALVVIVVFVGAIFHRTLLYHWRYTV